MGFTDGAKIYLLIPVFKSRFSRLPRFSVVSELVPSSYIELSSTSYILIRGLSPSRGKYGRDSLIVFSSVFFRRSNWTTNTYRGSSQLHFSLRLSVVNDILRSSSSLD